MPQKIRDPYNFDGRLPFICEYFTNGGKPPFPEDVCIEIVNSALQEEVSMEMALHCLYPLGRHHEAYDYIAKRMLDSERPERDRYELLQATRPFTYDYPGFYLIPLCHCFSPNEEIRGLANEAMSEAFDAARQRFPGLDYAGQLFVGRQYPFDWLYLVRLEASFDKRKPKPLLDAPSGPRIEDDRLHRILNYYQGRSPAPYPDDHCERIVNAAIRGGVSLRLALACLYHLGSHQEAYGLVATQMLNPDVPQAVKYELLDATRPFLAEYPGFYLLALCYCFVQDEEFRSLANELMSAYFAAARLKFPGLDYVAEFFIGTEYPFEASARETLKESLRAVRPKS